MIIAVHLGLIFITLAQQMDRIKTLTAKYIMSFAGMMVYIYAIIGIAKCNYYTPSPSESPNLTTGAVVTWFRVELLTWFGIIMSNLLFLFIRSMVKHKVDYSIYIDEQKKLP